MNAPLGKRPTSRDEYRCRINRVMDYIERNLAEPLSLETLAKVGSLSPFHFHKVFGALMGETLGDFVQRVRMEKAAALLSTDRHAPVSEVALRCGYSSPSAFARAFKKVHGKSASEWREHTGSAPPALAGEVRAPLPDEPAPEQGILTYRLDPTTRSPQWTIRCGSMAPVGVEIKTFPETHVAYVRYIGEFQGKVDLFAQLYGRLAQWAEPRGLLQDPAVKWLTICHDNPELTDDDRLRISCCLTVPAQTKVGGEIGTLVIPEGKYGVGHFRLESQEYGLAWQSLMAGWLPESGYQPDDRPSFELYAGPSHDGCSAAQSQVDLCIPVRPL